MKKYLVVLLMFGCVCRASITLFNMTSREVVREFEDYPTHLNPMIPREGLRGQHLYLRVANECSSELPPAPKDLDKLWFALLKYNSFCYLQQILNIQLAGYSAAILSSSEYDDDDDDDDGVSYYKTSSHSEVKQSSTSSIDFVKRNISLKIPSTFVSNKTEVILAEFSGKPNITMVIYPKPYDINRFLLILLGTLCLAIVVALVLFMVGYGCYRLYRIRKSIITKWKLKFLPSHTFRKGDTYEVCVICLDEYLEGARLRILSCGHAFHRKCVDPWLIKSGRECPLCKRKADLRRGRVKKYVGDEEDDEGSSADERTALLRDEARDHYEEDEDDDDINQVRIVPDQQTTINAIVHSSEDPPRSSGRRNYGSTRSEHLPRENLPQILIRDGQENAAESRSPSKPIEGDKDHLVAPSVHHPIPNLQDEQSRATFYIGSVATDDGGLLDAEDRRLAADGGTGGEPCPGHQRPSDEESEEDYYDVRNEDPIV